MKRLLIIWLMLVPVIANAYESIQQDTTILVRNRKFVVKEDEGKIKVKIYEETESGDTIKNQQIFEGIYLDGQSTEQRFSISVPFSKKEKNKRKYRFNPHFAGLYVGYNRLYDSLFSDSELDLMASKSWEIGLNLWDGSLNFSPNWGIVSGIGVGFSTFRIEGNRGLYKVDGKTILQDANEGQTITRSRFHYYHVRIPVALEWQEKFNGRKPLFVSFGPEVEMRFDARSKAKVNGKKKTLTKELNTHPVGINLLAQAGYGNWGFYGRYATDGLFESGKGPKGHPFSFGICWYW